MNEEDKITQDLKISQAFLKQIANSNDVHTINVINIGQIKMERVEPSLDNILSSDSIAESILRILEVLPVPRGPALEALITQTTIRKFGGVRKAAEFLGITPRGLRMRAEKHGLQIQGLLDDSQ